MTPTPLSSALASLVLRARPVLDSRIDASRRPYDGEPAAVPHLRSRRWAWTHLGIFMPLLPAPYRYLNTMTLVGATGTEVFDNDPMVVGDARTTSTVLSSTAYRDQTFYRGYAEGEHALAADGSCWAWGDQLQVDVAGDEVGLRGRYGTFEVDARLRVTDQVSYFVRTPVYQHWSRLAEYAGTVRDATGETAIGGFCTFEYARAMSPQALTRRTLPASLKLPADLFTYQVIALDEDTQLLLTDVRARGGSACRLAHVRTRDGAVDVFEDVELDVLAYSSATDPEGRVMRVPERFRWQVRDTDGTEVLRLEGVVDAPLRYGHGPGYVSAYSYTGHFRGRAAAGSAYLEWVDVRRDAS